MVQLVSNSSLSLVLINHRDISEVISVISKRGYLTVNRRTGIMIDIIVMLAFINHRFCQFSIQHFRHCCTLDLNDFRSIPIDICISYCCYWSVVIQTMSTDSNQQNHVGSDNNKTE